jgi:UDP-N-acetylmuramoyl-tripeptide--D-alanyl-D-alanine ligase
MESSNLLMSILFCLGFLCTVWQIACRYIHFFQQEEYDNRRFLRWWTDTKAIEKRATLATCVLTLYLYGIAPHLFTASPVSTWIHAILFAAILVALGWSNKSTAAKKPLVFTIRVKRILTVSLIIQTVCLLALLQILTSQFGTASILHAWLLGVLLLLLLNPFFIVCGNLVLSPYENSVQKKYLKEAKSKLNRCAPYTIGITGSYGKTSIKHILDHILNAHAPTLSTPGSVNTQMGITRIVRERLKDNHQNFIVEMGAYGIGSIKRLCELAPPQAALVTAVGIAHYERFKSQETVAIAKSELVQAIPNDGIAVLNGDDLYVRNMAQKTSAKTCFYGRDPQMGELHCHLITDELTPNGIQCQLEYQGKTYNFLLPLFGHHQALNAAGAFLMACAIGVPAITAIAALQTCPSINHRLVVQKGSDGITTIDDAYNSNPTGFAGALEVLSLLPGTRKILVTPGMVELGAKTEEEHAKLGPLAAKHCDIICLIAPDRVPSFQNAILAHQFPPQHLHTFATLNEARQWLQQELKAGDVILFENDLPDLYEVSNPFTLI